MAPEKLRIRHMESNIERRKYQAVAEYVNEEAGGRTTFATISLTFEQPCVVITLNPLRRRNAISLQLMEEIGVACAAVGSEATARSLIVTGGPEFFSAGAGLTEAIAVRTPAGGAPSSAACIGSIMPPKRWRSP